MYDDCLLELACAIIESARADYLTPLPSAAGVSPKTYSHKVDDYLRRRRSARRFFNSKWFSILSLNQLSSEEVFVHLDEKAGESHVNNSRISK